MSNVHAPHDIRLGGAALQPPCHACAFFETQDEEYEVLLPFIREGFQRGDKSFHIIDERRRAEYLGRLQRAGIDVAATEKSGQLEVRGWESAHLQPGWFDQHAMLALVESVLCGARARGFGHTRWVANMGWALQDARGSGDLAEYCARLNRVVPKFHATILCTYDLTRFRATQIVDVLRCHPLAIIGGTAKENPFYVEQELQPPKRA